MSSTRFTLLPDPQFAPLRGVLQERLSVVRKLITPEVFPALITVQIAQVVRDAFESIGADEGTIWLLDETRTNLVPVFNTGPDAERVVSKFRQPVGAGLISMVVANEQPFAENRMGANDLRDQSLDKLLSVRTDAMIAVPFNLLDECRGVISAVQLSRGGEGELRGFSDRSIQRLQHAADVATQLVDYRILSITVGRGAE